MIETREYLDGWIIVTDVRNEYTGSVGGGGGRSVAAEQMVEMFTCWNGSRWWEQRSTAMKFATEEDAKAYLRVNRERMLDARR